MDANRETSAREVLKAFGPPWSDGNARLKPTTAGWSGGHVFRVTTSWDEGALRCFPAETRRERVEAIHAVQISARAHGLSAVPDIIATTSGDRFVPSEGHLWELADWKKGQPAPVAEPHPEHLRELARILHHWYDAARTPEIARVFGSTTPNQVVDCFLSRGRTSSPGIQRRLEIFGRARELPPLDPERLSPAERTLSLATDQLYARTRTWFEELAAWQKVPLSCELCLRDLHREHLLFDNERVSGLIDFGSVGFDSPAVDLARYVSSFEQFDWSWLAGHDSSWEMIRDVTIDADEWNRLIQLLALTGGVASAIHWRQWLLIEKRSFASRDLALLRWANRLSLVERLLNEHP
jgi:Ser/Thr protein kinase RdoA (MazF antagonist)